MATLRIKGKHTGYTEIVAADNAPDNTVVLPTESGVLATENYVDSTITTQPPTTAIEEVEKNLSHTFELEDAGKLITSTSNDPVTFTVPTDLAVDFPIGTVIAIRQAGEGVVSVDSSEGVEVRTSTSFNLNARNAMAWLVKNSEDEWSLTGGLEKVPPEVATLNVEDIMSDSVSLSGEVTHRGGLDVIDRGIVYSTSPNPTLEDDVVSSGYGLGTFNVNLSNLESSTTYYVRAYATNGKGTSYGEEFSFVTSFSGGAQQVTDIHSFGRAMTSYSPGTTHGSDVEHMSSPIYGGTLQVNGQSLGGYDYVVKDGDQTISSFSWSQWFTNVSDSRSAWIAVNGNLTINSGITFTPPSRKLFTVIYVTGNLTVNGSVSMSARGANHSSATGSGIPSRAIRIGNGTYSSVNNPQIPASGGSGASSVSGNSTGQSGGSSSNGGTGGGGSGATGHGSGGSATSGAGRPGTAFSGGTGGGGRQSNFSSSGTAQTGAVDGGQGGNHSGGGCGNANPCTDAGGGAGNPRGSTSTNHSSTIQAEHGTGGTLIIIAEGTYSGSGSVLSQGSRGGRPYRGTGGGSSGGGSITILCGSNSSGPSPNAAGGVSQVPPHSGRRGGHGGSGTARILTIAS